MTPNFHAESIRTQLTALDLQRPLTSEQQNYQSFYGLNQDLPPQAHSHLGVLSVAEYQIVTQVWCPAQPRATLIVLHGYYDHMGLYRHLVRWALAQGFCVLSCDLPGHGLSSGAQASIRSFSEYQQVLQALLAEAQRLQLPQPWHRLGQSTGAAILLDYLLHPPAEGLPAGRDVLLAPLVRPYHWTRGYLSYCLLKPWVRKIPRSFSNNSNDADFLAFVKHQDPLQAKILPTAWVGALARWIPYIEQAPSSIQSPLIIQGDQDKTVDWQHNLPILQHKFNQPQIKLLKGARHHLVGERADIRQQVFSSLQEWLE